MADTLEGLRSKLLTTIFGRRFGLDPNDYAGGAKGFRTPVQTLSSASTSATWGGVGNIGTATGGSSWTLAAPEPGVKMTLVQGSTAGGVVTLASGNFVDASGATKTIATFANQGDALELMGLSTALAAVIGGTPMALSSASSTSTVPGVALS